jgi:energy-coupling factor transporter ATP-binding protein EcfA2
MVMASVCLKEFSYSYPFTSEPALKKIDLMIPSGAFVLVTGAGGAGKTSFCYSVSGLIPHFYKGDCEGSVSINDGNIADFDLRDLSGLVGLVFQNPQNQLSCTAQTVREEMACTMENLGIEPAVMHQRIDEMLEKCGIEHLADRQPTSLSGGQTQRVVLASALVLRPDILVLDEPLSQLDPHGRQAIVKLLKNLHREGKTIIVATVNPDEILDCVDKVVVLADGAVACADSPRKALRWLLTGSSGVLIPGVLKMALQAQEQGCWCGDDMPITLEEIAEGFKTWQQT